MRRSDPHRRHEGLREAAEFMASLWHGIAGVCWREDDLDDFWDEDWQDTSSPYRSNARAWWCDEFGTVMTSHPSRRLEDGRCRCGIIVVAAGPLVSSDDQSG
jgi:hypothetical protein